MESGRTVSVTLHRYTNEVPAAAASSSSGGGRLQVALCNTLLPDGATTRVRLLLFSDKVGVLMAADISRTCRKRAVHACPDTLPALLPPHRTGCPASRCPSRARLLARPSPACSSHWTWALLSCRRSRSAWPQLPTARAAQQQALPRSTTRRPCPPPAALHPPQGKPGRDQQPPRQQQSQGRQQRRRCSWLLGRTCCCSPRPARSLRSWWSTLCARSTARRGPPRPARRQSWKGALRIGGLHLCP